MPATCAIKSSSSHMLDQRSQLMTTLSQRPGTIQQFSQHTAALGVLASHPELADAMHPICHHPTSVYVLDLVQEIKKQKTARCVRVVGKDFKDRRILAGS